MMRQMIPNLEESSPIQSVPSGAMGRTSDSPSNNTSTLDEPIKTTIMREVQSIKRKFIFVLFPTRDRVQGLARDWDLWGPSILCLLLSAILAWPARDKQKSFVFSLVYVYVWGGSAIVTLNTLLLKGNVSFFQSVCVLGYCILPLVIAAVAGLIVDFFCFGLVNFIIRACLVALALLWSSKASIGFVSDVVPEDRRALAVYPVCLLYAAVGWTVVLNGET